MSFMIKKVVFLCMVTLFAGEAFSETHNSLNKINCELKPIERHRRDTKVLPHIRLFEGTSTNWSGYAAATNLQAPALKSVEEVTGAWTVPTVVASQSNRTYSSFWVGIDGYANGTVEQIGTEQDWRNGAQHNYAWFEMYPLGSFEIVGFPTNPGDQISASVTFKGDSVFKLMITNLTQNVSYAVPKKYTTSIHAKRSSAEWIVEAPYLNGVLPLANFGIASFVQCSTTINNTSGAINNPDWQYEALTMSTPTSVIKAIPTSLVDGGTSFSVTWEHE